MTYHIIKINSFTCTNYMLIPLTFLIMPDIRSIWIFRPFILRIIFVIFSKSFFWKFGKLLEICFKSFDFATPNLTLLFLAIFTIFHYLSFLSHQIKMKKEDFFLILLLHTFQELLFSQFLLIVSYLKKSYVYSNQFQKLRSLFFHHQ